MKLTMLGGGSLYFEYVMGEIACTPELAGSQIVLYDLDGERAALMAGLGERIIEATGSGLTVRATTDRADALDGADFCIASIGVHGPGHRWHKADTDAMAELGIIMTTGDTVGPSGLSQALRIIPIFVDIAQDMERYCPDAYLLNHSNPMSAICRAVNKYTSIKTIGYCHNVAGDLRYFANVLELPWQELDATAMGPNHCVWLMDIRHKGRDLYPELRQRLTEQEAPPRHQFQQEVLDLFGYFPIGGDRHVVEFFPHARRPTTTTDIHYGMQWRSDMIREGALAREISDEPDDLHLKLAGKKDVWLPKEPTPEAMGQQIKALACGPDMVHYVNVPNCGAVPNVPDWAVIELKAVVGQGGVRPIHMPELPPQLARWSVAQFYTHELTVDAAVEGSREKALMALASDAMTRDFAEPRRILDALVEAQDGRLDRFRAR